GLARVKRGSRVVDAAIAPALARAIAADPRARRVDVRVSEALDAPAAAGFRTPAIILPSGLTESIDAEALDQIALHEYAHLRRYDDWTNLFARVIERLYWFNPAVWFVSGRVDLERELACDDWATAGATGVAGYADCLWHLARSGRIPAFASTAPGAFLTRNQIAVRIEHLLKKRRDDAPVLRPSRLIAIAPVLAAALALAVGRAPAIALHAAPAPLAAGHTIAMHVAAPKPPAAHAAASAGEATQGHVILLLAARETPAAPAVLRVPTAPVRPISATAALEHVVASAAIARTAPVEIVYPLPVHLHMQTRLIVRLRTNVALSKLSSLAQNLSSHAQAIELQVADLKASSAGTALSPSSVSPAEPSASPIPAVSDAASDSADLAATDETDDDASTPINRNILAHCTGCDLSGRDLRGADLHGLSIAGDDLSDADLRGANLRGTIFTGDDLEDVRFDGADMRGAVLTGTDISGASFVGARLDGIKLVGTQLTNSLLQSVSARWILGHCTGCDLSNLDLHGRDLHGITLSGADLENADLSDADLSGAHLNGVDLEGAKLDGTNLTGAVLNGCDLRGVDLSHARIQDIKLQGSDLGDGSGSDDGS
ncbi:MAG TPA: pentapeptide repeat-containing protein, partial [Candidatus Eremiobacteraceae bacterium]|nr:pentapeptide repeat-containing protein [Candidatus Eremiobacteraceae bacterium]